MLTNTQLHVLYGILIIIITAIAIRLYLVFNSENDHNVIENFKSSNINKFKQQQSKKNTFNFKHNNKNSNKNNKNSNKNSNKNNKNSKITFDDIISESEKMNIEKYTISSLKESFWTYANSFNADKFKNTTGTNSEALEKLYMFKDKFFEIFN